MIVALGALAGAVGPSIAANLSCPPDCTGTAGSDTINGNGNNNHIGGRGSGDTIYGNGGYDELKGEGGADDAIYDFTGNDALRGGIGASDLSWAVQDPGQDKVYGGDNLGDQCVYDVSIGNDKINSTCEQTFPY